MPRSNDDVAVPRFAVFAITKPAEVVGVAPDAVIPIVATEIEPVAMLSGVAEVSP
jgi:hypothetical protein